MSAKPSLVFSFLLAVIAGTLLITRPALPYDASIDTNKDGCVTMKEAETEVMAKFPGGKWINYEGKVNDELVKTFLLQGAPAETKYISSYELDTGMVLVGAYDAKGCNLGGASLPVFIFQTFLEDAQS